MIRIPLQNPNAILVSLCGLILFGIASQAQARDLNAVSDGEHLWLVMQDPDTSEEDGPGRLVYHSTADKPAGELLKLEPFKGVLMKRGVAAGDGRLLMITEDRKVQTVRPMWSPLLKNYLFDKRNLPDLPEGCAVLSAVIGSRGPWLLVRVQDPSLVQKLEPVQRGTDEALRRKLLNRALDLPDDYELTPIKPNDDGGPDQDEAEAEQETPPADDAEDETQADEATQPQPEPVVRLITLKAGKWVVSPLPDDLPDFRFAQLLMEDDDKRPMLIAEVEGQGDAPLPRSLIRFNPIEPDPKQEDPSPQWVRQAIEPRPGSGGLWSAAIVDGQAVVAVERARSIALLDVEAYLLRGAVSIPFGEFALSTQGGARWSAVPWQGALAVLASPGPRVTDQQKQDNPNPLLATMQAVGLNGKPRTVTPPGSEASSSLVLLQEPAKPADAGNIDRYIQIAMHMVAMLLIMSFFRRAPRPDQIDLPDHIVFASLTRRMFAGFIDLTPGFLIAGAIFDTTMHETMVYWPGNGVPKVVSAMAPGFVVIGVTLLHTTLFELVTARSIGKWLTGLYVADLSGKPAGPMPCTIRSLCRVFDLFAWLIIAVALVSPARQRLGDIIAQTTVVMHKPEPLQLEDDDNA